jgi:predicted anti-sigma-YlaC factor YlaD
LRDFLSFVHYLHLHLASLRAFLLLLASNNCWWLAQGGTRCEALRRQLWQWVVVIGVCLCWRGWWSIADNAFEGLVGVFVYLLSFLSGLHLRLPVNCVHEEKKLAECNVVMLFCACLLSSLANRTGGEGWLERPLDAWASLVLGCACIGLVNFSSLGGRGVVDDVALEGG